MRGEILRQPFPFGLFGVLFGEQGLQGGVDAGQSGAGEQSGAGRLKFGAQKAARIEARGDKVAIAARAKTEAGEGDKSLFFIFRDHDVFPSTLRTHQIRKRLKAG